MAEFNEGGSLGSISVSEVPSYWERVASPVPSVAETFTVLWGTDDMVVSKEQWMGCQENLGSTCRSVTRWRSHCVFTRSGSLCVKWGIVCTWLYLVQSLRKSTEEKWIYLGALRAETYDGIIILSLYSTVVAHLSLFNFPSDVGQGLLSSPSTSIEDCY